MDPRVWATNKAHSLLYLFSRECPRVVIWSTSLTSPSDRRVWFGSRHRRARTFVGDDWLERIRSATIHRYLMPPNSFEDINDVGTWVSRAAITPLSMDALSNLPVAMGTMGVDLQSLPRLTPLKSVWQTTLHASGIRMRNARDWGPAEWSYSKPRSGFRWSRSRTGRSATWLREEDSSALGVKYSTEPLAG